MGVIVQFNTRPGRSGGRDLIVIPGKDVRAIFTRREDALAFGANNAFGATPRSLTNGLPRGLTVVDEQGAVVEMLDEGEQGPPVCYWVGDDLICW